MIEFDSVGFSYGDGQPVLSDVSFSVASGESVVLMGLNGSGKSSAAKLAVGRMVPDRGTVTVDGVRSEGPQTRPAIARTVGYGAQDPQDRFVASEVFSEVAFAPRCQGLPRDEVRTRTQGALELCGLPHLASRRCTTLSGGEAQRVMVAGLLAQDPRYLVLDETDSSLDGPGFRAMDRLKAELREKGHGLLSITHDPRSLFGADTVVLLEKGRMAWKGTPGDLLDHRELWALAGLGDDPVMALGARLRVEGIWTAPTFEGGWDGVRRLLADGGIGAMTAMAKGPTGDDGVPVGTEPITGSGAVTDIGASVADEATGDDPVAGVQMVRGPSDTAGLILRDIRGPKEGPSLDVPALRCAPGTLTVVLGRSGAGKTTLLRTMAGLLEPSRGTVELDGAAVEPGMVGYLVQRPQDQLFSGTVLADVAYGPRNLGLDEKAAEAQAAQVLESLGVDPELWGRAPFELSGGQGRMVALAGVLACGQGAVAMDEPSASLDGPAKEALVSMVRDLKDRGIAVVVTTHDLTRWIPEADAVAVMDRGALVWEGPAPELLVEPKILEGHGLDYPWELVAPGEGREVPWR